MSPVYDDNIGCIDFETYSSDSTGKQEVYAGVGLLMVNYIHHTRKWWYREFLSISGEII